MAEVPHGSRILKFVLPPQETFTLELPKGAKLLSLDTQRDRPCLWALCPPGDEVERRNFRTAVTGGPAPEGDLEFVGTYLLAEGQFVGHLFEEAAA